jgi:DNA-binding IclR family transcriptional regulator
MRRQIVGNDRCYYASRALAALEVLAEGPTTAAALGRALQIHPRTARRLLAAMIRDGYVTCPSRREGFRPTAQLGELGSRLALAPHIAKSARWQAFG